jgi:hypothetical protein
MDTIHQDWHEGCRVGHITVGKSNLKIAHLVAHIIGGERTSTASVAAPFITLATATLKSPTAEKIELARLL